MTDQSRLTLLTCFAALGVGGVLTYLMIGEPLMALSASGGAGVLMWLAIREHRIQKEDAKVDAQFDQVIKAVEERQERIVVPPAVAPAVARALDRPGSNEGYRSMRAGEHLLLVRDGQE